MHYDGANSCSLVNGTETHKFKVKDFETNAILICLGNISKDFSVNNIKSIGLYGYFYDLSVDYDAIAVDDILDVHKYVMRKNDIN